MNDQRTKDLGIMLANSKGWHWLPGMLLISEGGVMDRVVRVRRSDGWLYLASNDWGNTLEWYNPKGSYPDIFDPATLGCVISLLKFRMKEPTLHLVPEGDGWCLSKISIDGPEWYCGDLKWGLDGCHTPISFSSQQEAVTYALVNLDFNEEKIH